MNNSISVPLCSTQELSEQPNVLSNACSPAERQAIDAQTRLESARARREHDVTERSDPRMRACIRQVLGEDAR